jgi:hypothetical protein
VESEGGKGRFKHHDGHERDQNLWRYAAGEEFNIWTLAVWFFAD